MVVSVDALGNAATGSAADLSVLDRTLEHLLRYDEALLADLDEVSEHLGHVPGARILGAYLALMTTDADDLPTVVDHVGALRSMRLNERETAHLATIERWLAGDWRGASADLDALSVHWPTDVLALLMGHLLDFFLGDAANLRDRIGRALGAVPADDPFHSYLLGMHAFGLEESGQYAQAEDTGMAALAARPDDVWAVHAVVHVLEMQGRVDEGLGFLAAREADWGSGNLFTVHNWWHDALFLLAADDIGGALSVYDRSIHNDGSAGVPMEMLDASALLWRLRLDGRDTGQRFDALADAWAAKTSDRWYAFNDLHATMAMVGAERWDDARQIVRSLEAVATATREPSLTNQMMTADVGLPAAAAVLAFGEARYDDTVELLLPIQRHAFRFGGSHAQRDALRRTLLEAAIRSGSTDLALALTRERLSTRETDSFAIRRLERISRDSQPTASS